MGFQNTPVDSMATWVQPAAASQSLSANRSLVIVPKVRSCLVGVPSGPGTSRHATTVRLCTSRPPHRGKRISMASAPFVSAKDGDGRPACPVPQYIGRLAPQKGEYDRVST